MELVSIHLSEALRHRGDSIINSTELADAGNQPSQDMLLQCVVQWITDLGPWSPCY